MMYCTLLSFRSCQLSSLKNLRTVLNFKSFHTISSKQLLRSSIPVVTHERTFWETFPYLRPLYHEKDGLVRDKYNIVYHARLFNYTFYAQLGSFIFFVSEIVAGLRHVYELMYAPEVAETVKQIGPFLASSSNLSIIIAIALFNLQAIVMFVAAQTAVMRVYFCEETERFAFVKLSMNPFKSKVMYCNPGELRLLEQSPLNVVFGNHKLNNEKIFIRSDLFNSPHLYNSLLSKEAK